MHHMNIQGQRESVLGWRPTRRRASSSSCGSLEQQHNEVLIGAIMIIIMMMMMTMRNIVVVVVVVVTPYLKSSLQWLRRERERLRGRCMGVVRWLGRVMNFCFRGVRRGNLQIKTLD